VVHDGREAVEVRHGNAAEHGERHLAGHVSLDVACLDRIHRNGCLPTVQVPAGRAVMQHRGFPIPSTRWWRRWEPIPRRGEDVR